MDGGVLDYYSGAGGASLAMQSSGFSVLGAIDIDPVANEVYSDNLGLTPLEADVTKISYSDVLEHFNLSEDEAPVWIGCPPCKNFSSLRRTRPWKKGSSKDSLLVAFLRHIKEGLPNVVIFENVPGVVTLEKGKYFKRYLNEMKEMGYGTVFKVVLAADYGVPQLRKRVLAFSVLEANSEDLVLPGPTHSDPVKSEEEGKPLWKTVKDAIADLPPLKRGAEDPSIINHRAKTHTEKALRIIRKIPKDGGSRKDLPKSLWLPCHKKLKAGAESVYGRMWWNKPSPTMTTRCTTPSCGRFLHPEQDRAITPREAARLQSFPDSFAFPQTFNFAERVIGNAVPPDLFRALVQGFFKENRWVV